MLWNSRNHILAKYVSDPVDGERARWCSRVSAEDLVVTLPDDQFSFLLMGDTGEGDWSQYAVIPPLMATSQGTSFLFICSDVLYPIGDVNDYLVKFYEAYSGYQGPIYAIPGNHDWYDDLQGFMYHFCNRSPDMRAPPDLTDDERRRLRRGVRRHLWRRSTGATKDTQSLRQVFRQSHPDYQPGPYFVVDSPSVRLVSIDTGICGTIDTRQGAWLHRVSADPRPKVLLTGKPIWVDGKHAPCWIKGGHRFEYVDDLVQRPEHNYVAVIGGDVHNYQRYPVHSGSRVIQYLVSGGGGAFMHDTHNIPRIDPKNVAGVSEDDFKCYPLRRDSLAVYSRLLDRRLGGGGRFSITPAQAAVYLNEKLDAEPLVSRPLGGPVPPLTLSQRAAAGILTRKQARSKFHGWVAPFLDWDEPPFYKNFLRIEVSPNDVTITCYGVTGCGEDEARPCVEDVCRIAMPG
jgi:hypothetical protein